MSGKKYVIGDLHLSHNNMAKHRGFNSVEQHDEHIIECWNNIVRKNDVVYILGDITMGKKQPYVLLDRLKGFKKVVLGNHDMPQHIKELLKHVNSVCASIKMKGSILTHIPIHESELSRFSKNIHAHLHEDKIRKLDNCGFFSVPDSRYICVSCEQVNYTPILLDELLK